MAYKVEKIVPYNEKESSKREQVEEMFNEIAPNYDKLNHTLSFNLDKSWRKKGIKMLEKISPKEILDIATGTGDLSIQAYKMLQPDKITGIDISEKMMMEGKAKVAKLGLSNHIFFEKQDCSNLTFASNSFDALMVAFGIRNFEYLDKSLQEMLRVLRPKGRLMILELSTPEHFPFKQGYKLYSKIIPFLGKIVGKNMTAYSYLPKSISAFPQNEQLVEILQKNGFTDVSFKTFTFGTCTMYIGNKAAE